MVRMFHSSPILLAQTVLFAFWVLVNRKSFSTTAGEISTLKHKGTWKKGPIVGNNSVVTLLLGEWPPLTYERQIIRNFRDGTYFEKIYLRIILKDWRLCDPDFGTDNRVSCGEIYSVNKGKCTMAVRFMVWCNVWPCSWQWLESSYSLDQCTPTFFLSRTPWLGFSFMSTPSLHYPRPSLEEVFISFS
jgi:hypothetical protein